MWEWRSTSLPVPEMLGMDKKLDQIYHTRLSPPDENITTTCSYSTLAIRLVGGGIVVVRGGILVARGMGGHSSDRGPAVFLSPLATHAHTHTHTHTPHPHELSATDPTRKGLSNRRVINLTTQSPAPRAVHCVLVTRALLYTVYTSSSTDVFLISQRPEPLSAHAQCMRFLCGVHFTFRT